MPKEIQDMTVAELKNLMATLDDDNSTPEQRAGLQEYIMDRIVDEKLDARMERLQTHTTAKELDTIAKKRWPQLTDPESDFYKKVEAEVEARGDIDTNPRALLDAANAVGLQMGEAPDGWSPSENVRKVHALKPSGDPDAPGDGEDKFVIKHQSAFERLKKEGYLDDDDAEAINARVGGRE
jgi:hypothetical protein